MFLDDAAVDHHVKIGEDLKQYRALVLSGCAMLGSAHLGFLQALQYHRRLRFLKLIAGVSVGSIIAFLFLCGLSPAEIFAEYKSYKFIDLLDLAQYTEMQLRFGLASSDLLIAHLLDILTKHKIDPTITFANLVTRCAGKQLVICATRYSHGKFTPEYFCAKDFPDMMVVDAIRASISIPLLFTVTRWNQRQYVDGAIADNLPIRWIEKHYKISADDILGHLPSVQPKHPTDAVAWSGNIVGYAFNELNKIRGRLKRCVKTVIPEGEPLGASLDETTLLYYYQMGAHCTTKSICRSTS